MIGVNNAFMHKLSTETKKYVFKTDITSVYQIFWITYDILKLCPDADLDFDIKEKTSLMAITNTCLSYSQIQSILNENLVKYEGIS